MKTYELTGAALDWAVTKCETGQPLNVNGPFLVAFKYSTHWIQGGPIIEREGIELYRHHDGADWVWGAKTAPYNATLRVIGPTPLIAAMRCFVASKLGDEIEIPKELT